MMSSWIKISILLSVVHFQGSDVKGEALKFEPFEPKKDPWLSPSDGSLVNMNTKVYVLHRHKSQLRYNCYETIITHILRETSNEISKASAASVSYRWDHRNSRKLLRPIYNVSSDTIYPELMVVITFDYFSKFDLDLWKLIPYLLSYWNGVDMRYRGFKNPQIRLNIEKIVIESEYGLLDYMKPLAEDSDYWNATYIKGMYEFWKNQNDSIPMEKYDLAVTMSTKTVCNNYRVGEGCKGQIFGRTWHGGACKNEVHGKFLLVSDNGGYNGTTVAAHEIGHTLYSLDDGIMFFDKEKNDWGPPNCDIWAGYIMSGGAMATENAFKWSNCSISKFSEMVRDSKLQCLQNIPPGFDRPLPRYLPGKLMNADQQCWMQGAIKSCENGTSICLNLQCIYANGRECQPSLAPAAEGTPCGYIFDRDIKKEKICIQGHCVNAKEFS